MRRSTEAAARERQAADVDADRDAARAADDPRALVRAGARRVPGLQGRRPRSARACARRSRTGARSSSTRSRVLRVRRAAAAPRREARLHAVAEPGDGRRRAHRVAAPTGSCSRRRCTSPTTSATATSSTPARRSRRRSPRRSDAVGPARDAARGDRTARSSRPASSFAYSSASHLTPASRKLTCTRASSPRPSASMMTPTPNFAWRTLCPMRHDGAGGVACGAVRAGAAGLRAPFARRRRRSMRRRAATATARGPAAPRRRSGSGCGSASGRAASASARCVRYSRRRARVIATYMSRRSSSSPSYSFRLFSCGNRPSSRPVTNTVWNSRPFAECTVISCSAGRPSAACVSPASSAACARNAVSGSVAPSCGPSAAMARPAQRARRASARRWRVAPRARSPRRR